MPIYIMLILVSTTGVFELSSYMHKISEKIGNSKLIVIGYKTVIAVICGSILLSGLVIGLYTLPEDTRLAAKKFCEENGITQENSIYEGYSPFLLRGPKNIDEILVEDGEIRTCEEKAGSKFIILSSNMYERYYNEPLRYEGQIEKYESIHRNCRLLKVFVPLQLENKPVAILNIVEKVKEINSILWGRVNSGYTIRIYERYGC